MFAPTAPGGMDASASWVNLAMAASTFAVETWLLLRFVRCLPASSGASGAKATTAASTAAICFKRLVFIFVVGLGGSVASNEGS
jgi:hypothetical protein